MPMAAVPSELQGRGQAAVAVRVAQDVMEKAAHAADLPRMDESGPGPPTFRSQLDERPLFHNSRRPPSASVPYVLSKNGESVPYTINRYLRDYQREGVRFIYNSYARSRGCILGDDMGLGKTIQVIAFLAAVLRKTGTWEDAENNVPHFLLSQRSAKRCKTTKVFLIVAPLSLLYNWKDELDTWGYFRSIVVHGTRKDEEFARVQRGRCEIALTTYETLRLCMDQFNSINWSAIIVDEAHKIKNPSSQITQAMKWMKCRVRVGLTGTVLQNNLEELWCVMDWANPSCLGTLESFRSQFAEPIEQGQRHSATKRALATGREAVRSLARRLSRWFLRRTKALISDQLPRKDDRVVFCSLTDFQQMVYRTVLDSEDVMLLLRSGEKCCSSGRPRSKCCFKNNSKGVAVKDLYFSYLAILRKVANHVALLQPSEGTSKTQEQYVNEICEKVFQKFPDFVQRCKQAAFEAMSDPMYSGKMKVLQSLLNHYTQKKDKVLLFSLSTKLLDVLESYCMAAGLEFRRLDGATRCKDRVKIVKEFNSSLDINICLVSTMAGGLGLNFVGANVVVLFDPTWNPASDLQAIDRVYRIGQYRDVTVLRLISLGTIEEVIYLKQVYKQQLESAVVGREHARRYFEAGADGRTGELFGIHNLFRLQTQGACLTKQILEREGRLEAGMLTAETVAMEGAARSAPEGQPGKVPMNGDSRSRAVKGFAGVLDFSSASEDEDGRGVCRNPPSSRRDEELHPGSGVSPDRLGLLHHGLSSLLQGTRVSSGSESEESTADEDATSPHLGRPPTHKTGHNWTVSSDSEGEAMGQEKKDVGVTAQSSSPCRKSRSKRRRAGHAVNSEDSLGSGSGSRSSSDNPRHAKHTVRRQSHSSPVPDSDTDESDDVEVSKGSDRYGATTRFGDSGDETRSWSRNSDTGRGRYTKVKERGAMWQRGQPGKEPSVETIDKLLGGVQEVIYTHSNQRVVGSSSTEARMSRAAVRDVFQYGRNTQAPANLLLDSLESLSADRLPLPPSPAKERGARQAAVEHPRPSVKHPVSQTFQAVLRGRSATFIFGQTPNALRRQDLLREKPDKKSIYQTHPLIIYLRKRKGKRKCERAQGGNSRQSRASCQSQPQLWRTAPPPQSWGRDHPRAPRPFPQKCHVWLHPSTADFLSPGAQSPGVPPTRARISSRGLRKQLADMATYFQASSTRAFAEEVLNSTSSRRQVMLQDFYSSRDPQLKALLPKVFQDPVPRQPKPPMSATPEQASSSSRTSSRPASKSKSRVNFQTSSSAQQKLPEGMKEKKGVMIPSCGGAPKDPSVNMNSPTPAEGDSTGEPSEKLYADETKAAPASNLQGRSPVLDQHVSMPGGALPPRNGKAPVTSSFSGLEPSSHVPLLSDLIGDTSILDDLFKRKTRVDQSTGLSPSHASGHAKRAKVHRKDFWDILSEGNEECINKLTDLSQVEKICNNTNVAARAKNDKQADGSQLWRKNEKFLWKK
ncbi:DNA excision repair protein ERCC-6-like 2 isoform X1 [Paramormyrops kingsleyae]|uniref:DNA excision repair protein ERCC-6-like 2 isoform X1 n=2 Tax=Paramormyrops kingsleyae TaxID=1676925 RepID=UPI003B977DE4